MMIHRNKKNNVALAIAVAAITLPLHSAGNAQSRAEMREAVNTCQRIQELSSRLACYDRAFPPVIEPDAGNEPTPVAQTPPLRQESPPAVPTSPGTQPPAPTQRSAPAREADERPVMAQIINLEMPSVRTTRFYAADGRVFVRSDATIPRWPDLPFEVEVQTGHFGTVYLRFPATNLRVRVAVEDSP
jgi:hypothetical protein